MLNYSIDDLRAFCSTARAGQFTSAADLLSISPSALSRRIANLEEAIGGRVFDRSTRRLRLTPLGTAFYERTAPLLSQLDGAFIEASSIGKGEHGGIVAAMVATVATTALPQALELFYRTHPNSYVSVRDGIASSIASLVEQRHAEFGIATQMAFGSAIEATRLGSYGYNLVVNPTNRMLRGRSVIAWSELKNEKVVALNPLSSTRLQVDAELASLDLPLPWFIEVDQLSTLLELVRSRGLSAVLPSTFAAKRSGFHALKLVSPMIQRDLFLVRRKDVVMSRQGLALAGLLKDAIEGSGAFQL